MMRYPPKHPKNKDSSSVSGSASQSSKSGGVQKQSRSRADADPRHANSGQKQQFPTHGSNSNYQPTGQKQQHNPNGAASLVDMMGGLRVNDGPGLSIANAHWDSRHHTYTYTPSGQTKPQKVTRSGYRNKVLMVEIDGKDYRANVVD
ncbi:MAG: hypothetical protein LQ343_006262 [Gyalolechia ehrenbergii]|nr:MAG: hypothetical protein LQ343_006262 [Gyalolechia ehrenbergii]